MYFCLTIMYIYKITHIPSNRFYVGRTIQKLNARFKQHIKNSSNYLLRNLLNKYPLSDFIFEKIDEIKGEKTRENQTKLLKLEQKYLDKYFNNKLCMNFRRYADALYAEDFTTRAKQKSKRNKRIKELSKIDAYVPHVNKKDREKRVVNFKDEQYMKDLAKSAALFYHSSKTKEEEQKRREKVRASHNAKLKDILMFDLKDNYIGTYKSKRDIIKHHPDLHRRGVQKVLKGEYSQHKGYVFKYKE